MLAAAYLRAEKQFPLIGVGGIDSAATALAKIEAGATLVQLLTGFVFRGLALPGEIKTGLLQLFAQKSYAHIPDAVGVRAQDWASGKANLNELL
jgi:dihydroorotate dehydrogenase